MEPVFQTIIDFAKDLVKNNAAKKTFVIGLFVSTSLYLLHLSCTVSRRLRDRPYATSLPRSALERKVLIDSTLGAEQEMEKISTQMNAIEGVLVRLERGLANACQQEARLRRQTILRLWKQATNHGRQYLRGEVTFADEELIRLAGRLDELSHNTRMNLGNMPEKVSELLLRAKHLKQFLNM